MLAASTQIARLAARNILPRQLYRPAIGHSLPMTLSSGLARSARAQYRYQPACEEVEIDLPQGVHGSRGLAVGLADPA
jgi:hypothetical protein